MEIQDRSGSELLLGSAPDWLMRMMAIFFLTLILLPVFISGPEALGDIWVAFLLILALCSFFWQQDVMTRRIQFNHPPGQITVIYTPWWATLIPGAAYAVKSRLHLPIPSEDPKVEYTTGSYLDPLGGGYYEVKPTSVYSVSLPTGLGGTYRLYRGNSSVSADEIVSYIRRARRGLVPGGGPAPGALPFPVPAAPEVSRFCPRCHASVRPQDRFCQSCGAPLPAPAPGPRPAARPRAVSVRRSAGTFGEIERPYLVGSCVMSLVGGLSLLLGSFAGWEEEWSLGRGVFSSRDVSVSLLKHPAYFVIIAALSGLLLFTAWATLRSLMAVYDPGPRRRLKTASWTAIGAALGSLAGGLIFIVAMGRVEPIQWWLDWGFYGGLIGGALAAALLWLDRRSA